MLDRAITWDDIKMPTEASNIKASDVKYFKMFPYKLFPAIASPYLMYELLGLNVLSLSSRFDHVNFNVLTIDTFAKKAIADEQTSAEQLANLSCIREVCMNELECIDFFRERQEATSPELMKAIHKHFGIVFVGVYRRS